MADIKFRKVVKGTIKTHKGTVKVLDRSLKNGADIKHTYSKSTETAEYSKGLGDATQNSEVIVAERTLETGQRHINKSIKRAVSYNNSKKSAKESVKHAQSTYKTSKETIKSVKKELKNSFKTANNSVKVAGSSAKTTVSKNATKQMTTMQRKVQISKETIKITAQASKTMAKAIWEAIKATITVIVDVGKSLIAALSAGGWLALVALLFITIILAFITSAVGIVFSNEIQDENSLSSAQRVLNQEFNQAVDEKKASLSGYDKVVVRPAPAITNWNDIVAIYAVLAERNSISASELNDEAVSLLRTTLWDMVSFETTSEQIKSVEEADDGSTVEVIERYGVVEINYLTLEQASDFYHFDKSEQETLNAVLEMLQSVKNGILGNGDGTLINPCPDGRWHANDYPAYERSGEYHAGRDIICPIGTPVYASGTGTVIHINDQAASYGNHIMIDHGGDVYTLYAHCSQLYVSVGDVVQQGDLIALSGDTGNVTGPHLHFEVRVGGSRFRINNVDPLDWIS